MTPHVIQGKPSGFRLSRLRPGLLQRIGLLDGDVLQRVSGLDILRHSGPVTLTYEIW